ncbi:MAG: hypothetical protein AAFN77_17035 [Planctomycetota bacterium]
MLENIAWIAAAIIGLVLLVSMNRRRRPSMEKAYRAFDRVTQMAGPELERLSEVFDLARESVGDSAAFRERGFKRSSQQSGELILRQVKSLEGMSAELQRVLAEGDALLHPSGPLAQAANMTTSSRYLHCLNLIESASLQVDAFPEVDDMPDSSWVTFDQFIQLLRSRRNITAAKIEAFDNDLSGMENSVDSLQTKLDQILAVETRIQQHESSLEESTDSQSLRPSYSRNDAEWLKLPMLFDKLVPQLDRETQQLLDHLQTDPVGVKHTELPALSKKLDDVLIVATTIEKARAEHLAEVETTRQQLRSMGFNTRWVERRQRELNDEARRLVTAGMHQEISELAVSFSKGIKSFSWRLSQSAELANKLEHEVETAIEKVKAEVKQARTEIANQLGISETSALREMDYSPDDELMRAGQQWIAAKAALSRGDIDSSNAAIGEIEVETHQASRFIEDSLVGLKEFKGKAELGKNRAEKLANRMPHMKSTFEAVHSTFAEEALLITVDPNDPFSFSVTVDESTHTPTPEIDANTNVNTDIKEGNEDKWDRPSKTISMVQLFEASHDWIKESTEQLNSSIRKFKSGKILEACNNIDLIESDLGELESFIDRFESRLGYIQRLQQENQNELAVVRQQLNELRDEINQKRERVDRAPSNSIEAFNQLAESIKDWKLNATDAKPNPISDRRQIVYFRESLNEISTLRQLEDETYEEVLDAIAGVEREMVIARQLVRNTHNDGIPDSRQITQDQTAVDNVEQKLQRLKDQIGNGKRDFQTLDLKATQLQVDLSMINGRLRNELKAARQASQAIQEAAAAVFKAADYRGPYNIVVVGRPGAEELRSARAALADGKYQKAVFKAHEAQRNANNGLVAAQSQAARQRREVLRRQREQRRFPARRRNF